MKNVDELSEEAMKKHGTRAENLPGRWKAFTEGEVRLIVAAVMREVIKHG